jgi:hypothetical protein
VSFSRWWGHLPLWQKILMGAGTAAGGYFAAPAAAGLFGAGGGAAAGGAAAGAGAGAGAAGGLAGTTAMYGGSAAPGFLSGLEGAAAAHPGVMGALSGMGRYGLSAGLQGLTAPPQPPPPNYANLLRQGPTQGGLEQSLAGYWGGGQQAYGPQVGFASPTQFDPYRGFYQ